MRSMVPNSIRCYAVLMLLISIGTVQSFHRHHPRQQSSFVSRSDFDWKLAREVFQHEESNVVFSPFSIKLLLTLLYEAAEPGSSTQTQLEAALVDPDLNQTRAFYTQFLDASAQANGDYEFDIGTKMFLDKAHGKLPQVYTDLVEQTYRTSVDRLSFNGTKAATERINTWCEKVTRGRISELVTEDTLKDAQLILANVLFLKASWKNSFPDDQTHNRTFHITDGDTVTTEFMRQMDLYDYTDHEQLGAEVLRLPYKGRQFSMNMVLPHRNVSLAALTSALTPTMLDSIAEQFVREEVTVLIPKFRFNYGTLLNDAIQSLGIRDVFTRNAALPLLSPAGDPASNATKNELQVSKILQKAGIEINEKGTLAFAATEIQLVNKFGYDGDPIVFEANRPFLFYILDEETNAILFVGKVTDPSRSTP
uniref:Serpin domain-containing protein n=1 Tax=Anopheles christyi TaxID=43041 RepID=A0A240PKS3_9DIPT